jgi:signal transduction histidine kinase
MVLGLTASAPGQSPRDLNLRIFKLADGLAESACMSVTVTPQGQVLVRHTGSAGVSEFGGYTITVLPSPGEGNNRVYGSPAGQLWTVSRQGVEEFQGAGWLQHPIPEIAAEFRTGLPRVIDPVPLCPVRQGHVLLLLPDRLLEFESEGTTTPGTHVLRLATQTRLEKFLSLAPAHDGGLWISGAKGLAKVPGPLRSIKPDVAWQEYLPSENLHIRTLMEPHEDVAGGVTLVAESATNNQKVIAHFDGTNWTTEPAGAEKIRHAWREEGNSYWAATIDSLQLWTGSRRETLENEEISARQFFDVAVEPAGVFWIASSDGLLRFAPLTWRTPSAVQQVGSPVSGLTADQSGRLWFVAGNSLQSLQDEIRREFPLPATVGADGQTVRGLFPLKNGTMLLATADQAYRFQPGTGSFSPLRTGDATHPLRCLGMLKEGLLVVQRVGSGGTEPSYRLEIYDGIKFAPFLDPPTDPLLGTELYTLFSAQNGDFWLGSERGVAWHHDGKWQTFVSSTRSSPEGALWFAEPAEGKIWCATRERIWEFDGKTWTVVRSGFDRINDVHRAREGGIWVASNSGLHRFSQGAWVENGREEGLPATAIREVCEDARGRLWVGTSHGLSLYHPEADTDPPKTFIHELTARETKVPEGGTITLAFGGQDKWNYTRRQRLLFSHRLDGRDWSAFEPANNIAFIDLPAGKHYFDVRAMDRNGNVDPSPVRLEFAVILPWYKESRLVGIMLGGLAVALFFAGLAFNRHRQLVQSYAEVEQKVADRTRELEVANRALAHSQKMNALGTLAAGIAHDFNNILSIIKGSAQIIEENVDNPQKIATRVDRINTVVEQGAGIVKAMLGFSSDSGRQPGPCDINEVVAETLKLLGDRFLREVQISFDRAPDLPKLTCSKDLIQQIVLNFVLNAAESMDKQKRIILSTRKVEKAPADAVLAPVPAPDYLEVSVRDFGCGIPPENMSRIFEPFFTTKALSARRGTGLGLSMVYELAKKMDAGLAVESAVDQGSVFRLILPLKDPPPEQQKLKL